MGIFLLQCCGEKNFCYLTLYISSDCDYQVAGMATAGAHFAIITQPQFLPRLGRRFYLEGYFFAFVAKNYLAALLGNPSRDLERSADVCVLTR